MRPVVLTFVARYLPGYKSGGPVRTIANMVDRLGDEVDFRIVTADRDSFDRTVYPNVVVNEWNVVGKAHVFYTSPTARSMSCLARLIRATPHDVMYLNSFFRPRFTVKPLLLRRFGLIRRRPVIIAPRGEFSEGALSLKKWKKRCYLMLAKTMGHYGDLLWQASSQYEAADIRNTMGKSAQRIVIAPDVPAVPQPANCASRSEDRTVSNPLRVCFLSRIDAKKNLDYALRVLSQVRVPVQFSIYGAICDEEYWLACQDLFQTFPSHVAVDYRGVIDHAQVVDVLAEHHLFFLPTRGENFGHVIYEALTAGVPVLISDQTPWRDLQSLGVGWNLPLSDMESFRKVIEGQAVLGVEERAAQRQRARDYAVSIADDEEVLAANLALFTKAVK